MLFYYNVLYMYTDIFIIFICFCLKNIFWEKYLKRLLLHRYVSVVRFGEAYERF